jgi:uncharacterized coiled-coil protein SlyX
MDVTMDRHAIAVLQPVIICARSVLADMEFDDVPVALRKIARSSARTLPPPFAKSVIKELTTNESFRADVLEQYEAGTRIDEDLVTFLNDPDVGFARIETRADASRDVGQEAALASARARTSELDDQLAESKRRFSDFRAQHEKEIVDAKSSVSESQRRAEARIQALNRRVTKDRAEVQTLTEQIQVLTDELAEVKGRLSGTAERLRRRDASPSPASRIRTDETTSDPIELARWLDDVEHRVRPFREISPTAGGEHLREPLTIGSGISPDSGEALQSLIVQDPLRIILDGYNIGGEIDDSNFSTRPARDDVIRRAEILSRATEAEVVIVFDGQDHNGRSGFRSAEGVSVRFSKGEKADDVIADLVAQDSDRVVVVTNDRDLRGRCAVGGCVQIWSTAFLDWL